MKLYSSTASPVAALLTLSAVLRPVSAFTASSLLCSRRQQSSLFASTNGEHRTFSSTTTIMEKGHQSNNGYDIKDFTNVLPMQEGSHNSVKIIIPPLSHDNDSNNDPFSDDTFDTRLTATLQACLALNKSAIWIQVHMSRARLIQDMAKHGLTFHHAMQDTAVLNKWLRQDAANKIPAFSTHNVGVGAVVINKNEILLVRELRKNYTPWKTPTGLSDLGESIEQAAVREVFEETGVKCTFKSILGFRQTHGLAHGRSDLFFVCQLDPVIEQDENGQDIRPTVTPQACEIETAAWVSLDEYREMIQGENGHPMMKQIIDVMDAGQYIQKQIVESVVPGRKPNSIYYPSVARGGDKDGGAFNGE